MYITNERIQSAYRKLAEDSQVRKALSFLEADAEQTLREQIRFAEIPAPPFLEEVRATELKIQLQELGLEDVQQDLQGNVFGLRKGTGSGPTLFVSAHIDSVFSAETETNVTERDGIYYGPGITDDARGLAALLSIVRAFNESGIETHGDLVFGGTVGEEGPGDLRGVKAFFTEQTNVDGFISIDAVSPEAIVYKGTGSYRYEVTYSAPGGHSFQAFGTPSAVHAAGRATAKVAGLTPPKEPKTTFNVGVIEGGTIPTAIAESCTLYVDIRSNGLAELEALDGQVRQLFTEAAEEENAHFGYSEKDGVQVLIEKKGDRPVGAQPKDASCVQTAWQATKALGLTPSLADAISTDANYPISIGIPALTLGAGGETGATHSLDEWYDPTDGHLGPQRIFLTILGLVGALDIEPQLAKQI
ncbi:M20/M25/M40 family metallo-hydrolase [Shouchella shacheensis]|uniref:M20/M25/M40 family metallo-hydrolase n=1 Tax=Shouchella shacheensis TaxID=1649580 RepID=UPI0007402A06|nr:M20/M25/M40 family metallo-hydrolase [Shouchella shacheensis]